MIESKRPSPPEVLALFHEVLARMDRSTGLSDAGPALWPRFAAYYERLASLPRHARRSLQRRWRCSLAGLALLLALGQVPALAATITVDGTACSLIDAITAANTDTRPDTSGCTAGSGADTIVLQPGSVHTLTAVNNGATYPVPDLPYVYGPNGLPLISSDITIEGNGSTIIREQPDPDRAVDRYRILAVSSGGNLTVQETRISGGRAMQPPPNPEPRPPPPNSGVRNTGGGVFNAGTLSLSNSTVSDSSAQNRGGGIYNAQNATLILANSTISGNSARTDGGGVWIGAGATVSLMDSTVSGNLAGEDGGGFDNAGTLTVANSTLSGNSTTGASGSYGGGVNNNGIFKVVNSTVSGNSTSYQGGGVLNGGTMDIANSTIANNAAGVGGGLLNRRDGVLTFTHTLVSGNTAQVGPEAYNALGAVMTDNFNGFNLFGHDGVAGVFGFSLDPTDLVPNAALNGILSRQLLSLGGPTRTLPLVAGSPAVDAIPVASCTETLDQRGALRPQDGDGNTVAACDIGAFELGLVPVQAEFVGERVVCRTRCQATVQCNLTDAQCTNPIEVTVPRPRRRNSDGPVTKAPRRRILFATGVANIPPGGTQRVRLQITPAGRRLAEGPRRLRGRLEIMEIAATVSNTPPLTISRTPVLIRLRRR